MSRDVWQLNPLCNSAQREKVKTTYVFKDLALQLRNKLICNNDGGHKGLLYDNILSKRNNRYGTLRKNVLHKGNKWQLSN